MDSDSTIPALDEIGAKLYEMGADESNYHNFSDMSLSSEKSLSTAVKRSKDRVLKTKNPSSRRHPATITKRTRPFRQSRRPTRVADDYTDSCSDDDFTTTSTLTPTIRTRTRTGYQNSQSSLLTLEDVMAAPEKEDSDVTMPTPAVASNLTPEQLEVRRRRIERRRESAKNKAEREMQEIVERLLRVNTDYGDGGNSGGRGRARRGPAGVESDSGDSNGEKKKRNALHPSHPLDPLPGSIRFISSQRIKPHCVIILSAENGSDSKLDLLYQYKKAPSPPKMRLCDQCNSAPRKYTCPSTGRSLCSLKCFKAC